MLEIKKPARNIIITQSATRNKDLEELGVELRSSLENWNDTNPQETQKSKQGFFLIPLIDSVSSRNHVK